MSEDEGKFSVVTGVGEPVPVEGAFAADGDVVTERRDIVKEGCAVSGLVVAMQVFLAVMVETGNPLSELALVFDIVPQKLVNVRYKDGDPLEADSVKTAIKEAETRLGKTGRLVIRKSGTEPLVRVMAEADDADLMDEVIETVASAVRAIT